MLVLLLALADTSLCFLY